MYELRAMTRADLPLVRTWLHTPEVVRWWGDPDEQEALLLGDLDEPRMAMRIVSYEGRPFAYAQHYAIGSWPQSHFSQLPQLARAPLARAIDSLIGEPDMLGRGHGARYLRLFAERILRSGAPLVVIDPDADNLRARRAYARAGFVGDTVTPSAGGDCVVMIFAP